MDFYIIIWTLFSIFFCMVEINIFIYDFFLFQSTSVSVIVDSSKVSRVFNTVAYLFVVFVSSFLYFFFTSVVLTYQVDHFVTQIFIVMGKLKRYL
jgi:hypothetical protein